MMKPLIVFLLAIVFATPAAALTMKQWNAGRSAITDEIHEAEDRGADPGELADLWIKHGDYGYSMSSAHSSSKPSYKKAVKILEQAGIPDRLQYALALVSLGKSHVPYSKKKARQYFDQAMPILKTEVPGDHHIFQTMAEFYAFLDGNQKPSKPIKTLADGPRFNADGEPVPIFRPHQRFPREAMMTLADASIVLYFTIEADGTVSNARVAETKIKANGTYGKINTKAKVRREYRREALRAIKQYKFRPAIVDGEYVAQEDQHIRLVWKVARR